MSPRAIAPGDLGVDYSYSRPSLATLVQAGAKFVLRYSAGAASSPTHPSHGANAGKLISPAEFRAIASAGLDVIANDEWYEGRITEGAAAGRQDAAAAMALWRSCGLNRGSSIYVSWDAAPVSSKWAAADAYLEAYQATLAGYYYVDLYAGTPYLRHARLKGLIRYGWRPNAGDWSGDGLPYQPNTSTAVKRSQLVIAAAKATPARLWQTGNYWAGRTCDEDMVLAVPVGSHLENAAQPPAPAPAPAVTTRKAHPMLYGIRPDTLPKGVTKNCFYKEDGQAPINIPDGNDALALAQLTGQQITSLGQVKLISMACHRALGGPSTW